MSSRENTQSKDKNKKKLINSTQEKRREST